MYFLTSRNCVDFLVVRKCSGRVSVVHIVRTLIVLNLPHSQYHDPCGSHHFIASVAAAIPCRLIVFSLGSAVWLVSVVYTTEFTSPNNFAVQHTLLRCTGLCLVLVGLIFPGRQELGTGRLVQWCLCSSPLLVLGSLLDCLAFASSCADLHYLGCFNFSSPLQSHQVCDMFIEQSSM